MFVRSLSSFLHSLPNFPPCKPLPASDLALLSATTFWAFLREFSPLEVCGTKSVPMYGFSVRGPASYRLRIKARAIQSSRPVIMLVEGGVTGRVPGHVAGFFEVPPGKLTTIELIDRAIEGDDTFAFGLVGGFPWWSVNADEYEGAGLFLGDIHIEGPLEEWPRRSRIQLLDGIDPAEGTLEDPAAVLGRILPRTFRRSTGEVQVARLPGTRPAGARRWTAVREGAAP